MVSSLVTDLFSGSAAGVAGYFSWSRLVVGESTSGGYRLSLATVVHVDECFVFRADGFEGRGARSHKRGENRRLVKACKRLWWPCLQVDGQRFCGHTKTLALGWTEKRSHSKQHLPVCSPFVRNSKLIIDAWVSFISLPSLLRPYPTTTPTLSTPPTPTPPPSTPPTPTPPPSTPPTKNTNTFHPTHPNTTNTLHPTHPNTTILDPSHP